MTALQTASLNKKVNYEEFGVLTKREFLETCKSQGWTVQVKLLNGYANGDYNRKHFNRLSGDEQAAYEAKMAIKKEVYSIHPPEGSTFYDITKTEFEYFNNLPL
jgi:hypothetical protein